MVPAAKTMPVIEFRDVCKRVSQGSAASRAYALVDLQLSIEAGECVLLSGPSGAGKTCLLRLLAGLDHPDRGEVRIAGRDLAQLGARERPRMRRNVGVVLREAKLLEQCTALENLLLALEVLGVRGAIADERARSLLADLGFPADRSTPLSRLSEGERRCVTLARAVVGRPPILALDEVAQGLEGATAQRIYDVLGRCRQEGATIILSAHEVPPRALFDPDRRLRLETGRLVDHRYTPVHVPGQARISMVAFADPGHQTSWKDLSHAAGRARIARAAAANPKPRPAVEDGGDPLLELLPAGRFTRVSSGREGCFSQPSSEGGVAETAASVGALSAHPGGLGE